MLCYAWNKLEEKEIVSVEPEETGPVLNLLTKVLLGGIDHLFKRGLDRGYILHAEDLTAVRGRLLLGPTLRKYFFRTPAVICEYDEFGCNVLHNQILKTILKNLCVCEDLDADLQADVVRTWRRFEGVSELALMKKHFRQVQLHRNNAFYDFLLRICELIWDNLLICEHTGRSRFRDFLRDERQMAALFEEFVRNFYRHEQSDYQVSRKEIIWDASGPDGTYPAFLPKMQTDICLTSSKRVIVMDTKYYQEALQEYYDREKIRSGNLYQLFAYVKNLEAKGGSYQHCEGILLYPTVRRQLDEECLIGGHRIAFKTINLAQNWRQIHADLLQIIQ
jgi:5-methylcytosine-specific restriction enzyme subunit McrC